MFCRFGKSSKKFRKYFLIFRKLHLNWLRQKVAFTEREYLPSGVNMITDILKILNATKPGFLELILFQRDQETWQKYCCEDFRGLSHPLTRGFLGIKVTLLFAVYNFRKKSSLRLTFFFSKKFQILCRFWKCRKKKLENIFWFWDNCISIGCIRHSLLLRENTCHQMSIC